MRQITFILLFVFSLNAPARVCIEKDKPSAPTKEMVDAFKAQLDGKNKSVVPPGLPQDDFKVRELEYVANVRDVALIFVRFKTSAKDKDGFIQPFNFWIEKNKLEPVPVPDLGNGDSRFWRAKSELGKDCGRPRIDLTFDGCIACGDGKGLRGHFDYSSIDKKWTYFSDTM
jgi:hypothetical protein